MPTYCSILDGFSVKNTLGFAGSKKRDESTAVVRGQPILNYDTY